MEREQPIGEPWERFSFALGRRELISYYRGTVVRGLPVLLVLIFVLPILIAGGLSLKAGQIERIPSAVLAAFLEAPQLPALAVALSLFLVSVVPVLMWRSARKDLLLTAEQVLCIHGNGVQIVTRYSDDFMPWYVFHKVERRGSLILFWLVGRAFVLPIQSDRKRLLETFRRCRQLWRAARNSC